MRCLQHSRTSPGRHWPPPCGPPSRADDALFAGSSSPIRDLDLAPVSVTAPRVYANRGLSGIDGNVSTAAGIALALERPTHALLGDLTAMHDATGLLVGQLEPQPNLRLVVRQ